VSRARGPGSTARKTGRRRGVGGRRQVRDCPRLAADFGASAPVSRLTRETRRSHGPPPCDTQSKNALIEDGLVHEVPREAVDLGRGRRVLMLNYTDEGEGHLPSSWSIVIATPVTGLLIEWIRKMVSLRIGAGCLMSCFPAKLKWTTLPWRARTVRIPATLPSSTSRRRAQQTEPPAQTVPIVG
jgi:hypothetical protein